QSVEPQSIQEILLEYFSSLERAKQWAPVRIQLDLAEDQSTLVRVQKDWIYAMLEILMNNLRQALANRPDPHCFIQSSPVFSQNKMVVTMTDNGPGFSSQVIKSIFKRPIKKRRTESGAGIGLLIARLIVETYGGKISGKNVEGGGAMIKIELPFDDLVYLSNGSGPIDLN
ncbi:MAG: HAMP domain-containing sensor histidine kinase, partial [Chloroflexota bacterium]